nr:unnamed protein product [Haemonchus contortus]
MKPHPVKVLCVGCVESCRCVRSIGALEYVISDPAADKSAADKISVLHVDESYDVSRPVEKFPRGTLVLVPGKLVRFKGAVAIQAYSIREILCQEEYECLQMEAFLALQYHTKNPSGQTPGRRSSTGSNLRRSSSSVTPTSKGSGDSVRPDDKRGDSGNKSGTLRESESQDSFEDSVFLKSDDN